jgi:hypothetical protein
MRSVVYVYVRVCECVRVRLTCLQMFVSPSLLVGGVCSNWLVQWYTIAHSPIGYNISAVGTPWLSSNTLPPYVAYHFMRGTFINTDKYASELVCSTDSDGVESCSSKCFAPIVAVYNQSRVLFWVALSSQGCCTTDPQTCWTPFQSVETGYSLYNSESNTFSKYEDLRVSANAKLADPLRDSVALLNALPAVIITLIPADENQSPEQMAQASYAKASIVVGALVGVFACVVMLVCYSGKCEPEPEPIPDQD